MASFIIAKIVDNEENAVGYRLYDMSSKTYVDKKVTEILAILSEAQDDSFSGVGMNIVNAKMVENEVVVEGYDKNPVLLTENGVHYRGATYTVCGFNPLLKKFIFVSYDGVLEKLELDAMEKRIEVIGEEKVANVEIVQMVRKETKKEAPKIAFKGNVKKVAIPAGYEGNELVNDLYDKVNSSVEKIMKAYILHTRTKNSGGVMRHYELDDNGQNIGKDDYMNFDVNDSIVDTFVLLQDDRKKFISLPVCMAFKPLIEAFEISDITVDGFKDFLDFLADEYEDLELVDEKAISEILGGAIVTVVIDNTENVTYEVIDNQPQIAYDKMDATFTVEVKDKGKKTKEYVIPCFPWVMY